MGQPSSPQYLFLHAIKEVLQHDDTESEIIPYTSTLWENLVVASQLEDNKAIGAECIGRLTIIDPKTYLPQLQVSCHSFLFFFQQLTYNLGVLERPQGKLTRHGHFCSTIHLHRYR